MTTLHVILLRCRGCWLVGYRSPYGTLEHLVVMGWN